MFGLSEETVVAIAIGAFVAIVVGASILKMRKGKTHVRPGGTIGSSVDDARERAEAEATKKRQR